MDWIENFRASKETFAHIREKHKPFIKQQDTKFRKAICIEHRVAITLWCLTTCGGYRTIYLELPDAQSVSLFMTPVLLLLQH